ncbi:DUF2806 domain-containing protein [Shinella sp.]|nr:DUF2806 domain-containing protein [Shinella sp.]
MKNLEQISKVEFLLSSDPVLAEAMKARLVSTEMRRQSNIHNASRQAVKIANNFPDGPKPQELDEDFVQEWVEGVKDISNEDVQNIWSRLLAAAPTMPNGRISRPALELLKQMDQPTALCFKEFAKIWSSVGFPSIKAPPNWAPFGVPVRLKLLMEIGVIERQLFSSFTIPHLGVITQIDERPRKFQMLNTLDIYVWGQRAMELGGAIFKGSFDIDEEAVHRARVENFSWLVDEGYWSLGIKRQGTSGEFFDYMISPNNGGVEHSVEQVFRLEKDNLLDSSWRQVLRKYADDGRLTVFV